MLDLTPRVMREEIEKSLKLRRSHTEKSRDLIKQYAGPNYRGGWSSEGMDYYNHPFQWVVNIVPNHVLTNPDVYITDMGIQDDSTRVLTWAMRSLIPQMGFARQARLIAYDQEFDFGVGMVRLEPTGGWWKQPGPFVPMRPVVRRLSPRVYGRDHCTPEYGRPRYEFHIVIADIEDMRRAKTFDGKPKFKNLDQLAIDQDVEKIAGELMGDGLSFSKERKQVVYFEVWVPERDALLCMGYGDGDSAVYLRDEREYKGPETGPYQLFGTYSVPDQVYPLPNLAVTKRQAEEINKHRKQQSLDAGTAKRLGIVNGAETGIIAKIQDAPSGSILCIPGFSGMATNFEFGGPLPQTIEHTALEIEQLDRLSGLTEMQRGNVTGVTATETAEAAAFADTRLTHSKNIFTENTVDLLNKVVALCDESDDVAFPVAVDTPNGRMRGTFYGGAFGDPTRGSTPWKRSLTTEIKPESMNYTNRDRRRAQLREAQEHALAVYAAAKMDPAINATPMVDDMFEALNMPFAGGRYYNQQLAAAMQLMQMEIGQGMAPGPAGDTPEAKQAARAPELSAAATGN